MAEHNGDEVGKDDHGDYEPIDVADLLKSEVAEDE